MEKIVLYLHDVRYWAGREEEAADRLWPERRQQAARLSGPARLRCLAGGWLLQRVLGRAACLTLRYGEQGKPRLAAGPDFNLSHAGDLAALAVGPGPLGVDVEQWRPAAYGAIARRVFHPQEQAYLTAAADKQAAFFRLWTAKESYVKARGGSLFGPTAAVNCLADLAPLAITALPCPAGYSLSLCGPQGGEIEIQWLTAINE